jgi:SAM-dependent methyltransferase
MSMSRLTIEEVEPYFLPWWKREREDLRANIVHRMKLVEFWSPEDASNVLEVGCGQGDTAIVLACYLGKSGRVLAVDKADGDYGTPPIGEVHRFISSTPLASRVTFQVSTDLLDRSVCFREKAFDLVVISHSSWYFSSKSELHRVLLRIRPWAKYLAYAEWDIVPDSLDQLGHLLAVLIQGHVGTIIRAREMLNARCILTSADITGMVESAGWQIIRKANLNSSIYTLDAAEEVSNALRLLECVRQRLCSGRDELVGAFVESELELLRTISMSGLMRSLGSFAFLAK